MPRDDPMVIAMNQVLASSVLSQQLADLASAVNRQSQAHNAAMAAQNQAHNAAMAANNQALTEIRDQLQQLNVLIGGEKTMKHLKYLQATSNFFTRDDPVGPDDTIDIVVRRRRRRNH